VFEAFLLKAKETDETRNLQTPDARVISPAALPVSPSFPKKKLILALALLLGSGLGLSGALLAEMRAQRKTQGNKSSGAGHVASTSFSTAMPVIATLPSLGPDIENSDSLFYNVFEALQSPAGAGRAGFAEAVFNILDAIGDKRVVSITAPSREQGATTLAFIDRLIVHGTLPEMLDEAERFIRRNTRTAINGVS